MSPRLPSLLEPPLAFADGGAGAVEQPGSAAAFTLAIRLGATGIEANAYVTADEQVVLGVDSAVRHGLRRRDVSTLAADEVASSHSRLLDVATGAPSQFNLALAATQTDVVDAVVRTAANARFEASGCVLWIRSTEAEQLRAWRRNWPDLRLIHDTTLASLETGPERHAALLADAEIDAIRFPYPDWTGGLAVLFHRFELFGFGHTAIHDRMFDELIRMGLDGISSPHVDRLVDAFTRADLR